jgi:hypothetical protein
MLAEIASGDTDAADIIFLIAAVVFAVAAVVPLAKARSLVLTEAALTRAGLCLAAVGLLLL